MDPARGKRALTLAEQHLLEEAQRNAGAVGAAQRKYQVPRVRGRVNFGRNAGRTAPVWPGTQKTLNPLSIFANP